MSDLAVRWESLGQRFWGKVVEKGTCWEWTGGRNQHGYGRHRIGGRAGRKLSAHRLAYAEMVSEIPEGLDFDHLCRNRSCVNPAHLEPVSTRENVLRSTNFIARRAAQTHCLRGHPLSGTNLLVCSDGGRRCRACKSLRSRRS